MLLVVVLLWLLPVSAEPALLLLLWLKPMSGELLFNFDRDKTSSLLQCQEHYKKNQKHHVAF
jgi:hypothetical protein